MFNVTTKLSVLIISILLILSNCSNNVSPVSIDQNYLKNQSDLVIIDSLWLYNGVICPDSAGVYFTQDGGYFICNINDINQSVKVDMFIWEDHKDQPIPFICTGQCYPVHNKKDNILFEQVHNQYNCLYNSLRLEYHKNYGLIKYDSNVLIRLYINEIEYNNNIVVKVKFVYGYYN